MGTNVRPTPPSGLGWGVGPEALNESGRATWPSGRCLGGGPEALGPENGGWGLIVCR